MFAISKAADLN